MIISDFKAPYTHYKYPSGNYKLIAELNEKGHRHGACCEYDEDGITVLRKTFYNDGKIEKVKKE